MVCNVTEPPFVVGHQWLKKNDLISLLHDLNNTQSFADPTRFPGGTSRSSFGIDNDLSFLMTLYRYDNVNNVLACNE
jgi:hypothetical protein